MLSTLRTLGNPARRGIAAQVRTAATQAQKRAGDISDAFVSLSGQQFAPLPAEYAVLKGRLLKGHEREIRESWERLLRDLREEIPLIVELGSKVIPELSFEDIDNAPETFNKELKKRGVAVIRGVVQEQEALLWKEDLRDYIKHNPHTKGEAINSGGDTMLKLAINSFPCRQPTSLRALLVENAAPSSRSSKHAQNAPLPHVLLAQHEPSRTNLHTTPHQLRRPTTNAPPRRC